MQRRLQRRVTSQAIHFGRYGSGDSGILPREKKVDMPILQPERRLSQKERGLFQENGGKDQREA
jgi:hypothetical protein